MREKNVEREMETERKKEREWGGERESTSGGNPVTRKGMCKCHRERWAAISFL